MYLYRKDKTDVGHSNVSLSPFIIFTIANL